MTVQQHIAALSPGGDICTGPIKNTVQSEDNDTDITVSDDTQHTNNDCGDSKPDSDAAVVHNGSLHLHHSSSVSDMAAALRKHLAHFMLKLREKHCLARNVRNSVVHDLKCVCGVITTTLCDTVRKQLQEAGISADNNGPLQQVLNVENFICGAFDDISSKYKLTKFCKKIWA